MAPAVERGAQGGTLSPAPSCAAPGTFGLSAALQPGEHRSLLTFIKQIGGAGAPAS